MAAVDSIREALPIIGRKIVEITTDDWKEVKEKFPTPEDRVSFVYLHFDDGSTLTFPIGEGHLAFSFDGYAEDHPFHSDGE